MKTRICKKTGQVVRIVPVWYIKKGVYYKVLSDETGYTLSCSYADYLEVAEKETREMTALDKFLRGDE